MGKAQREKRQLVTFRCGDEDCRHRFQAKPDRIEDLPEQEFHPFEYFAKCPECGKEAEQMAFERNLMKAHANATGPRTPQGKAIVAKNLEGHPTPAEAQITRFNAMKHGLYARATKYFPARPGKYDQCEGCQWLNNGCGEISDACLKRVEIFMQYDIAYSQNNPALLRQMDADLQATVRALVNDILLSIVKRGVEWETPEWFYDKDGGFHLADGYDREGNHYVIKKVQAHPLLKPLIELIKANGMTMPDHGMTQKSADEDELLRGHLAQQADERESEREYRQRMVTSMEGLKDKIERSQQRVASDPVLLEHGQEENVVDGELVEKDVRRG